MSSTAFHALDDDAFRAAARAWLEQHCPASLRGRVTPAEMVFGARDVHFKTEDQRRWFESMRDMGWFAPDWPAEYGGGGLSPTKTRILESEMKRLQCFPPQVNLGVWMLGPVLLEYGSEAQKQRYLTEMTAGTCRWCQGFSEPNAGSDLASLKTFARREGDHFILNGSKIWTSHASESDWMYLLARTRQEGPKQAGIGFFLVDLKSAGVDIKPIDMISGKSHFCQVFFDQVKIPADQLIGREDQGWEIAKRLLVFERMAMSKFDDGGAPSLDYEGIFQAAQLSPGERPVMSRDYFAAEIDDWCFKLLTRLSFEEGRAGRPTQAMTGCFKYLSAEIEKRRAESALHAQGFEALEQSHPVGYHWMQSKTLSIAGGTSEIQLNILAKRILKMPDEPQAGEGR
ncbi:CaiA Acyl-CoA dehydrogenases [Burkholderiales bacterium]